MTGYRKILLWAFHGFILSGVFTSYSHAADVNLTHFFTNDRKLRAELSSEDLLGFELPKGTGLANAKRNMKEVESLKEIVTPNSEPILQAESAKDKELDKESDKEKPTRPEPFKFQFDPSAMIGK